jgi:hypothetical protein
MQETMIIVTPLLAMSYQCLVVPLCGGVRSRSAVATSTVEVECMHGNRSCCEGS